MRFVRVHKDVMLRLLVVLGLIALPLAGQAATTSPPPADQVSRPRDGGLIDGQVTSVDYQRSVMGVRTASRGLMDVTVMPSTSIQSKVAGYHTFTDVKSGQHVQIYSSVTGGKYVAQIIRIL